MKLHIITIGQPKLAYAKIGWDEYIVRLQRYHQVRTTHIADKQNDTAHLLTAMNNSYKIALSIEGEQFSSYELAGLLEKRAIEAKEVSFIIGGPMGLPADVLAQANLKWSLSRLTFPHDLAMIMLLETLYRASTINAQHPYHK
jgi:23S rRNA (pseudouridine1915-N3)-methyltransferase